MASRRSSPLSSKPLIRALVRSRDHLGKEGLKSGNDVTPGHAWSSGVPRSLGGSVYEYQVVNVRRGAKSVPKYFKDFINL